MTCCFCRTHTNKVFVRKKNPILIVFLLMFYTFIYSELIILNLSDIANCAI